MAISNYRILFEAVLNDTQLKAGVNRLISSNSQLQKSFNTVNKKAQQTAGATKQATTSMNHSANTMGKGLKGFAGQWVNITKKVVAFGAATAVIRGAGALVGKMVTNVVELDKALVELSKVSNLSGDSLKTFTKESFEAGKTVARTGTEMISAATEFAKAGYGEDRIVELARIASMYQNIADTEVSASQAAGTIIAMTKAFSNEGLTAIQTIDKINEVANKFAVSSADIATALPKVASTLSLAGNSSSESIGLLVAATELMPNQASRVARGLRSISLNLQGMTAEGDKSLVLTAKMEKSFSKIGMTLTDETTGGLKSTYDILKELSGKWKDLTPDQQKYYAALIGGKQQVDVVAATIKNFSAAVGATETAINSAGSAAQENEKYLKGIEGRVAGFNSQFQLLSQQLINTDLIKGIVSFGTGFLKALTAADAFIPKLVLLTTAVWALSKAMVFVKNQAIWLAGFTKLAKGLQGLTLVYGYLTGATVVYTAAQKTMLTSLLALAPWLALIGAIAGVGIALYNNVNNFEENKKQIEENSDKIDTYKSKIQKLYDKFDEHGRLSNDDYNRLYLFERELAVLEKETAELKKQADIQFRAAYQSSSTDPITGKKTETFEGDLDVKAYEQKVENILRLDQKVIDARAEGNEDEAIDAAEKATALRDNISNEKDAIVELYGKYKENWKGREDEMSKADKQQMDMLEHYTTAFALVDGTSKDVIQSLSNMGEEFGISVDALGNLEKVDVSKLVQGLTDAGASEEKIKEVLETLKKTSGVDFSGTRKSMETVLTTLGYSDDEIKSMLKGMDLVNKTPVKLVVKGATGTESFMSRVKSFFANIFGGTKTATVNIGGKYQLAKGTKSAKNAIAEVNEEGFELIRDKNGVRIAGGGERTITKLNQGDEVMTHKESIEMLKGKDDIKLDGFASGTHAISTAMPSRGHYSKETSSGFDKSKNTLDHQLAMGYISEQKYYEKLTALRNSYYKAGKISLEDSRNIEEEVHDYNEQLKQDAYDKEVERLEKLEEKYSAQQELLNLYAEKQVDNIDKKIEGYEKEKDELNKQNEASEKANALTEAQIRLTEAKTTKVKVYRAGVGFGYESDQSAIDTAQKELDALKAQYALDDKILAIDEKIATAEEEKAKWADIASNWQDEQDIKNLEQTAGVTLSSLSNSVGGSLATFDKMYSNTGAQVEGYADALAKMEGTDKIQSASTIASLINANRHATGTMSAQSGLSLVGEQGAELKVLGQGDGIMPNNITKNLMDIGRFNAKQLINAGSAISKTTNGGSTEFNFGAGSIVVNGDNAETLAKDIINNMNRIVQQNEKQRN